VLLRSLCNTVVPKLLADDLPLFHALLTNVFPGVDLVPLPMEALREQIKSALSLSLSLSLYLSIYLSIYLSFPSSLLIT